MERSRQYGMCMISFCCCFRRLFQLSLPSLWTRQGSTGYEYPSIETMMGQVRGSARCSKRGGRQHSPVMALYVYHIQIEKLILSVETRILTMWMDIQYAQQTHCPSMDEPGKQNRFSTFFNLSQIYLFQGSRFCIRGCFTSREHNVVLLVSKEISASPTFGGPGAWVELSSSFGWKPRQKFNRFPILVWHTSLLPSSTRVKTAIVIWRQIRVKTLLRSTRRER